jgi:hypothetical protein
MVPWFMGRSDNTRLRRPTRSWILKMFGWLKKRKAKIRVSEITFIKGEIEDDLPLWETYMNSGKEYDFDKNELIAFSAALPIAAMNYAGIDLRIVKNFAAQFLTKLESEYGTPSDELAKSVTRYFEALMADLRKGQSSPEGVIFNDTATLLGQSALRRGQPYAVEAGWLLQIAGQVAAKVEFFQELEIT